MKNIKLLEKMQKLQGVGFLSLALLSGCGPQGADFSILGAKEAKFQGSVTNNKVDVLFVIDNSGTMAAKQARLAASLESFAEVFQTKAFDFHVGVITTDAEGLSDAGRLRGATKVLTPGASFITSFKSNVIVGTNGLPNELPFNTLIASLSDPIVSSDNAGFLRADAHLAVVIISDEDQDDVGGTSGMVTPKAGNQVITFLNALKPEKFDVLSRTYKKNYTVSAVVAPSLTDPECIAMRNEFNDTFEVGTKITALANLTGGSVASICKTNFAAGLTQISQKIAEAITEIPLGTMPNVNTITVLFNGTSVPKDAVDGWTYSASGNKIVFHGDAIPTDNTNIAIDYIPNDIIR